MDNLTDAEIDAALDRGRIARLTGSRASSARYERAVDRIVVELTNGCTFAFPPRLVQGLETATEDQISQVELLGEGYALHWENLDTDLTVPGLLAGVFGTRAHMARLADLMGGRQGQTEAIPSE